VQLSIAGMRSDPCELMSQIEADVLQATSAGLGSKANTVALWPTDCVRNLEEVERLSGASPTAGAHEGQTATDRLAETNASAQQARMQLESAYSIR